MKNCEKTSEKARKNVIFALKFIGVAFLLLLSLPVGLVLHEGSHMVVLGFCNGTMTDIAFGTQSFVGGYTDVKFVPVIAMSSIFIPLVVSIAISFIKNIHILFFNMGLSVSTIINITFGLFATAFIQDGTVRKTYDVALAYDFANIPILVVIISIICFVLQVFCICWQLKKCNHKIDNYFFS